MSAYGIYDMEIDYMFCGTCKTEVFTWMAKVFACPTCGDMDYKFPKIVDTIANNNKSDKVQHEKMGDRLGESVIASKGKSGKKRKRKVMSSDEEIV
jgi:hypothetical protein